MPRERAPAPRAEGGLESVLEVLHLREHHHVVPARVVEPDPGEGERVLQRQRERPDGETATAPAGHVVPDTLAVPAGEAGEDEPGRAAEGRRYLVLHQEERGGRGGLVVDLEVNREALAQRDLRRRQATDHRQPVPGEDHEDPRDEGEDGDPDRGDVEARRSHHPGGDPQEDPAPEDDPSARRQHQGTPESSLSFTPRP